MRLSTRTFALTLALSTATAALGQTADTGAPIALATAAPVTLEEFVGALRRASGRPVLLGLTSDHAFLGNDLGHRLKINWNGSLAGLLNGVAPRYGVHWAEEGDTILLFDAASARPKVPVKPTPAPPQTVAIPPSTSPASTGSVTRPPQAPIGGTVLHLAQAYVPAPQGRTSFAARAAAGASTIEYGAVSGLLPPRAALDAIPQKAAPRPVPQPQDAPRVATNSSPTTTRISSPIGETVAAIPPQESSQLNAIRAANLQSTQVPTSAGFVNSTIFYDYVPGAIYELHTSPRFISTIALRPGEKLISKAAGDTVRWVMGETQQGDGANAQTLVFVKPIRGDLRTNIVLTTSERTYMIEAVSHSADTYTSILSWNYPHDQLVDLEPHSQADREPDDASTIGGIAIDRLRFGYKVKALSRHKPEWMPTHVFDDGTKTYIEFSPDIDAGEAPPLFVIGAEGHAELVNYRMVGHYYVIDRLISSAELRLGEKKQQIVRITRKARSA